MRVVQLEHWTTFTFTETVWRVWQFGQMIATNWLS
jgi:hypothetical protein